MSGINPFYNISIEQGRIPSKIEGYFILNTTFPFQCLRFNKNRELGYNINCENHMIDKDVEGLI